VHTAIRSRQSKETRIWPGKSLVLLQRPSLPALIFSWQLLLQHGVPPLGSTSLRYSLSNIERKQTDCALLLTVWPTLCRVFWRQGLLTLRSRFSFLPHSRISNGRPILSLAFSVWQCLFRCSSCFPRRVRNPSRKLIFCSRRTFHPGKQDLVPDWMSELLPFDVEKQGERETRIPLCNKMRTLRSLLSRGRVCEKLGVLRKWDFCCDSVGFVSVDYCKR